MDAQDMQDWIDFCEGNKPYDPDHFASIFMEFCLEPLTERDKDDLGMLFSHVPNSSRTLQKMLRLDDYAKDKTDDEIVELVHRDLKEKRRIIDSELLTSIIDSGATALVHDEDQFHKVCDGELNRRFFYALANYFTNELSHQDDKIRALSKAFYGLASNVHLQWALTADLLGVDVSFDNYYELYLIGVDYALEDNRVMVMNYRSKMVKGD